eukprot:6193833-Pleurochrysis_carterae.AAC.1
MQDGRSEVCARRLRIRRRGLEAWSKNHPLISFVDVSEECKQQDVTPCPLAEVWVTASDELSASAVASALSGVRYSSTFR